MCCYGFSLHKIKFLEYFYRSINVNLYELVKSIYKPVLYVSNQHGGVLKGWAHGACALPPFTIFYTLFIIVGPLIFHARA
jgi:hypothetical protein